VAEKNTEDAVKKSTLTHVLFGGCDPNFLGGSDDIF
jgi:hypothetical protein